MFYYVLFITTAFRAHLEYLFYTILKMSINLLAPRSAVPLVAIKNLSVGLTFLWDSFLVDVSILTVASTGISKFVSVRKHEIYNSESNWKISQNREFMVSRIMRTSENLKIAKILRVAKISCNKVLSPSYFISSLRIFFV